MRLRGLEPPRALAHGDLNAARLPIPPQPQNGGELIAWPSGLDPHMLEERSHVLALIEPDRAGIAPRPQADLPADRLDQIQDVRGEVPELVAEVLVAARSVDEDAAVRADAASQKRPRRGVHKGALPGLQEDATLVLLTRAVLREQTREVR